MDCYYIRDKIQDGSVTTKHVDSAHQLVDVLTKPPGKDIFVHMVNKLGDPNFLAKFQPECSSFIPHVPFRS